MARPDTSEKLPQLQNSVGTTSLPCQCHSWEQSNKTLRCKFPISFCLPGNQSQTPPFTKNPQKADFDQAHLTYEKIEPQNWSKLSKDTQLGSGKVLFSTPECAAPKSGVLSLSVSESHLPITRNKMGIFNVLKMRTKDHNHTVNGWDSVYALPALLKALWWWLWFLLSHSTLVTKCLFSFISPLCA
jgi:hypothetical protein